MTEKAITTVTISWTFNFTFNQRQNLRITNSPISSFMFISQSCKSRTPVTRRKQTEYAIPVDAPQGDFSCTRTQYKSCIFTNTCVKSHEMHISRPWNLGPKTKPVLVIITGKCLPATWLVGSKINMKSAETFWSLGPVVSIHLMVAVVNLINTQPFLETHWNGFNKILKIWWFLICKTYPVVGIFRSDEMAYISAPAMTFLMMYIL